MTKTSKNSPYATTYHRDGTVTLWDVYAQTWMRLPACRISDKIMATLSDSERRRIRSCCEAQRCHCGLSACEKCYPTVVLPNGSVSVEPVW